MSTVQFHKTNRVDDPGYTLTFEQIAEKFLASDHGRDWATGGGRLARALTVFMASDLGGFDASLDTVDELVDLVLARHRAATS